MVCTVCGDDGGCDCHERLTCHQVGDAGHHACGFCSCHQRPRWMCGGHCLVMNATVVHDTIHASERIARWLGPPIHAQRVPELHVPSAQARGRINAADARLGVVCD